MGATVLHPPGAANLTTKQLLVARLLRVLRVFRRGLTLSEGEDLSSRPAKSTTRRCPSGRGFRTLGSQGTPPAGQPSTEPKVARHSALSARQLDSPSARVERTRAMGEETPLGAEPRKISSDFCCFPCSDRSAYTTPHVKPDGTV